ncbi:Rho-GTPase-activating protein 8 [Rhodosporidiobolus nylandii]
MKASLARQTAAELAKALIQPCAVHSSPSSLLVRTPPTVSSYKVSSARPAALRPSFPPPPSSSSSSSSAGDAPLSTSSSLKRATGAGRLRGARAPRPPSHVMDRIRAFEGGAADGDKTGAGAKRESWTTTRGKAPVEADEE